MENWALTRQTLRDPDAALDIKLQIDQPHLARKFRNRQPTRANRKITSSTLTGQLPSHLDPAEALVFWLFGLSAAIKSFHSLVATVPGARFLRLGPWQIPLHPATSRYFPFDQKHDCMDKDGDGLPGILSAG